MIITINEACVIVRRFQNENFPSYAASLRDAISKWLSSDQSRFDHFIKIDFNTIDIKLPNMEISGSLDSTFINIVIARQCEPAAILEMLKEGHHRDQDNILLTIAAPQVTKADWDRHCAARNRADIMSARERAARGGHTYTCVGGTAAHCHADRDYWHPIRRMHKEY